MKNDYILKGNIPKAILKLSAPLIFGLILQTGYNIIDTIFVGKLGIEALAAISVTFPIVFFMIALASGIGLGTTSIISRNIGAKKLEEAKITGFTSLILFMIITLIFSLFGVLFGKHIFTFMGIGEDILPLVLDYSKWIFGGSFFMFFGFVIESILRAEGNMKTPMYAMIASTLLNIILDPLLIFGLGPFPRLEIEGAAIATIIARAIGTIGIAIYFFKGNNILNLKLEWLGCKWKNVKEILYEGIPASFVRILMSTGQFFLTKIIASMGTVALAAFGIGFMRIDSFIFMPAFGVGMAIVTLVGQNVGAKKYDRAKTSAIYGGALAAIIMVSIAFTIMIFKKQVIGWFTDDLEVARLCYNYISLVWPSFLFIGFSFVILNSFQGAGKPMIQLFLPITRFFIFIIPITYYFGVIKGFGISALWKSILAANISVGIVSIILFFIIGLKPKITT
ncbi:hypothetical protein C0585_00270 [Candidatus Woesearchaeota archaeon]|nr:MAG: hypothetical protein C0585_00270 [Candidatus Woesearchaeota archaeon]